MIRITLCGALGKMGRKITEIVSGTEDCTIVSGIDRISPTFPVPFPVFASFADLAKQKIESDVIIDFSAPVMLDSILEYAKTRHIAVVFGATGYSDVDLRKIKDASGTIPIFRSANMSIGIHVLKKLCGLASRMLPEYDIEIVERHHNQKKDAPSGTALLLLDAVAADESRPVFGREGKNALRDSKEIGIHAIRGGTVTGEHEVGLYGFEETLLLTHRAQDRSAFAYGALKAAGFIVGKSPAEYGMDDLFPY